MKIAMLQYNFMFDPAETWSSLYEFESDLAKFFSSKSLDAQIIKSIEGQSGNRILYIKKKLDISLTPNPQGRPKTPQGKLKDESRHVARAPERDFGTKKLNVNKIFNKVK
jgi:hypothetical protein